jgi:Mor family transcriptional regulator
MGVIELLSAELCTLFINNGEVLYIPSGNEPVKWGEKSGSKVYFEKRNMQIKHKYQNGFSIEQICYEYGLAHDTVRKILYKKTMT